MRRRVYKGVCQREGGRLSVEKGEWYRLSVKVLVMQVTAVKKCEVVTSGLDESEVKEREEERVDSGKVEGHPLAHRNSQGLKTMPKTGR